MFIHLDELLGRLMANNLQEKLADGSHILVYDLGGGTFDVSVLLLDEDLLQVKATGGIQTLGAMISTSSWLNISKT